MHKENKNNDFIQQIHHSVHRYTVYAAYSFWSECKQRILVHTLYYLDLCSEDEWRSYGFGTTRGQVIIEGFSFLGELSR